MGYTTTFEGEVAISPPLNEAEIAYLKAFNESRRMDRAKGPYHAEPGDNHGQNNAEDVRDYNSPPEGQPGLWCQWVPTDDGTAIEWDGGEKFYDSPEWMAYIIKHFLKPDCLAKDALPFLQANHVCNGSIEAQGEDSDDRWQLAVVNNAVTTAQAEPARYGTPTPVE